MFNADLPDSSVSSTQVEVAQEGSSQISAQPQPTPDISPLAQAQPPSPVESSPAIGELIRDLSNGLRNPEDLDAWTRQECVLQLTLEGFSNEEIACVLRISERTVTRDRKAVRKAHALKPDCELGDELLGEFQEHMYGSVRRLTRLCNDSTTPPAVRVRAEEAIGRIYQRFTEQVRRFAYAQDGSERLAQQQMEQLPVIPQLPEDASAEEYAAHVDATFKQVAAMNRIGQKGKWAGW